MNTICQILGHKPKKWKVDGDGVHLARCCPVIMNICNRCHLTL